ncbi:hypothetical protein D3C80_2032000 [compost metagenome]
MGIDSSETIKLMPRTKNIPASVIINAGSFSTSMIQPISAPNDAPINSAMMNA